MTPEWLAEIKGRCEAATPGPWVTRDSSRNRGDFAVPGGRFLADRPDDTIFSWSIQGGCPDDPGEGWSVLHADVAEGTIVPELADLDFVAHARRDLPELVAEVERLTAELNELRNARIMMRRE